MNFLALLVFFMIAGTFGICLANFELRKPNNRYNITREDAKWPDWVSIFILTGFYGLASSLAVEEFLFDGNLNHELFVVFALLGASLNDKVFRMVFSFMGRDANASAKYYNERINEELNSNTSDKNKKPPREPNDDEES